MYLDTVKFIYQQLNAPRMPRIILDQRGKFDTDELFLNLSRLSEVKYVDHPSGSEEERRRKFLQDCHDGRIDIAFSSSGFNLELHISTRDNEDQSFVPDKIDLDSDPPKVHICSHFILNGVCVRWRGWIDRTTLKGNGCVEFDEQRASFEEQRLQQELSAVLDGGIRMLEPRVTLQAFATSGAASSSTTTWSDS